MGLLDPSKSVQVYRNLTKKCYSVRQGGRVVAHVHTLYLKDATFVVQPAGRMRVRREGRKNVHAYIKGTIVPEVEWIKQPRLVMYDPYKFDSFVDGMTWKPVHSSPRVLISEVGVLYSGNPTQLSDKGFQTPSENPTHEGM